MTKKHYLFITGKLAENNLRKVLENMDNLDFSYDIKCININVAALLTTDLILKKIGSVGGYQKIILPGKARGDISKLEKEFKFKFYH